MFKDEENVVTSQPTPVGGNRKSATPSDSQGASGGYAPLRSESPITTQPTSSAQGGYLPIVVADPMITVPQTTVGAENVDLPNVVVVTQPISVSAGGTNGTVDVGGGGRNADNTNFAEQLSSSIVVQPVDGATKDAMPNV